jgi:cyclase
MIALALAIGLAHPSVAGTKTVDAAPWSAPEGFVPPPLHPGDTVLRTQELAPGVYALLSDRPAVDNSGFVVGERGVLVVDAHINGTMARQIQAAVRKVTNKPILYLVNTNFHGDHTFGNHAFPDETVILAHRATAERMRDFEHEKRFLLAAVEGDASVFADVRLRLPDVVFDNYLSVDLGGVKVELHHFGPGNTPGDTVVYVPRARVAWTGNLVVGQGTIPPLFEGRGPTYLRTIARFAGSLDVDTIIPGHGRPRQRPYSNATWPISAS